MAKPIMSYEAVVAAARDIHLNGGSLVDIQALAARTLKNGPSSGCYYESTFLSPAHCAKLVCVIGAFFHKHDLLDTEIWHGPADGVRRIGSIVASIGELDHAAMDRLVDVPDWGAIRALQVRHDDATADPEERAKLREELGLEPA